MQPNSQRLTCQVRELQIWHLDMAMPLASQLPKCCRGDWVAWVSEATYLVAGKEILEQEDGAKHANQQDLFATEQEKANQAPSTNKPKVLGQGPRIQGGPNLARIPDFKFGSPEVWSEFGMPSMEPCRAIYKWQRPMAGDQGK